MDTADVNNTKLLWDNNDSQETPVPGTSGKTTSQFEELKPTSKGVENAKKRLRAFSIQKKSSLSPVTVPTKLTTVGAVGTVYIGKLASSKPALKPGGIEEVDPKKLPKPPKPGTNKLQNADYLNIQKKTLSEIEAMKRKMELVDLGIPLGLICPAPNSDKAMPTKAMPPIKSMMLDSAKVDEIIREAKQARAEGKTFKFSYEKLLPSYQNPFARKGKDKDKERVAHHDDKRYSRDKRNTGDNFRRYSSIKNDGLGTNFHTDKDRERWRIISERDQKEERNRRRQSKFKSEKSKKDVKTKKKDVELEKIIPKPKEKIDTIDLSDDDDDVQVIDAPETEGKETDVNLKDFVVCDSWSENEERANVAAKKGDKKAGQEKTTPIIKYIDPMEQLKQSLNRNSTAEVETKVEVEKLKPVTDSFRFEIDDNLEENTDDVLDMFSKDASIEDFAKIPLPSSNELYNSPVPIRFDYEFKEASIDGMDESFLESIIDEIKQEDIDEEVTHDKGLVEYDISPKEEDRESVTPEIDDRIREMYSIRSDCSDGFKSVDSLKSTESGFKSSESGYKSTESGFKSSESGYKSTESRSKSIDSNKSCESYNSMERSRSIDSHKSTESGRNSVEVGHKTKESRAVEMTKSTVDSLETWSFVLKICQPLLFRHDKNKCYKETRGTPKIWYAENPKLCDCVKDRSVVYDELEMCKMELVDHVYGTDQVQEAIYPEARGWYPANTLAESGSVALCSEWEAEDSQEQPTPPPHTRDEMVLDREYQKFMEAVWPDVEGAPKSETPRSTPIREVKKRAAEETDVGKKKKAKLEGKLSSEGWSQESEVEEEIEKNKKQKVLKVKRKRKHSTSSTDSDDESSSKKKKKLQKKEKKLKAKTLAKRERRSKKYLRKLKEKQVKQFKKKKLRLVDDSEVDLDEQEKEKKKRNKKMQKKKLLKQKKRAQRKKARSSSSSSSDSESDRRSKRKDKRKKHKKRKETSSESNQSEIFDVNILKNIKTERLTDDEVKNFSPNKKHREIINVKQLQNDFVSIQIKKEIEDVNSPEAFEESFTEEEKLEMEANKRDAERKEANVLEIREEKENETEERIEGDKIKRVEADVRDVPIFDDKKGHEFKEPEYPVPSKPQPDENLSQCSSQESIISVKEVPYEKDDSHLRPSSQNSNYNFHDVMRSEGHGMPTRAERDASQTEYEKEIENDMGYEQGDYEMYEKMAMEYQSDVASQRVPPPDEQTSGRIETVVLTRNRGEIKCDWRAGDPADPVTPTTPTTPQRPSRWGDPDTINTTPQRPSRWGLKPSEVNIVLTGGSEGSEGEPNETFPIQSVVAPTVYKIQSLANRTDNNSNTGYDEAYMDMYGASDRLQYGDCFSRETAIKEVDSKPAPLHSSSLDDRINLALRTTILGEVAKDDTEADDAPDKGILITKSLVETRAVKRVSFADGYKPGQDSDTEDPPVRKKKRSRRTGCPWPCPADHPDHVSLWDALPPPAPPPGSPPPPMTTPPIHVLRALRRLPAHHPGEILQPPHHNTKFDPTSLAFMPPEPPPGLISF